MAKIKEESIDEIDKIIRETYQAMELTREIGSSEFSECTENVANHLKELMSYVGEMQPEDSIMLGRMYVNFVKVADKMIRKYLL